VELPRNGDGSAATVVEGAAVIAIERTSLKDVADEVARALSFATIQGGSAYVSTSVTYPNGCAVVVRIDQDEQGYFVTDGGQGAFIAETIGGASSFPNIARAEAERAGVSFDDHSIFAIRVPRDRLPGATATIANVSNRAVERTALALETARHRRSQDQFRTRLRSAFGDRVAFDLHDVRGQWRSWKFDAGLMQGGRFNALFTFVPPAFNAVANASLKLKDVRGANEDARLVVALADYNKTEEGLRALLSTEADSIVAADSDPERFRQVAA